MYDTVIPSADSIPVHWLWFQVLLILTFFLHMILVSFLLGGSLLTAWDLLRGKTEKGGSGTLPTLLALTVNLGVPPLLFVQVLYGHLFYSSSVILAVPWILVIPVIIVAYYGAYIYVKQGEKRPLLSRIGLGLTSVCLLYMAFIFVNNSTLALRPDRWGMYFGDPGGMNLNLGDATLWPRYLHFVLGALAVGAVGRAIYYHFSKSEVKAEHIRRNLKIFGWVTVLQFGIGTWFWLSMPREVWLTFMGGSLYGTILMAGSWLVALMMLHSAFTGRLLSSVLLSALQILLMILIRDLARVAYLDGIFSPKDLQSVGEVSPLVAFLLTFVIGLVAIYYMIVSIFTSKTPRS